MLTNLRVKTLAVALVLAGASLPAAASLNLKLDIGTANQMGVQKHESPNYDYLLVTAGTDPYVYTMPITRPLEEGETILSFEYSSTGTLNPLEVFFGYPAQPGRSGRYGEIPQSAGIRTFSVDLAEAMAKFDWGGRAGMRLRLDFGSQAQVGVNIRHIRIHKAEDDPWVDTPDDVISLATVQKAGLPILEITTVDGEEPTFDKIDPPAGSMGAGITNATKVPGRVRILEPDGTVSFDSGDYVKKESGMTVKVRGNTSAYTPKKPYKIKLQKKADMLCRGDKKYNDKNWALLKDESQLMRNGFKINELMGMQWTPQCRYVNVMFNGEYRGMYLLAEAVERNTGCRLDVDDTGFIVERDAYWWNEDGCYVSSSLHPAYNYTFKYPDFEEMIDADKRYVEDCMLAFEASVGDGTYASLIDCRSFASWLLGHDILGTYDSGGANMYFTKYDNTPQSLIMMGNLWDFDSTERCRDAWSNLHVHTFPSYFYPKNKSPEFTQAYLDVWNSVKGRIFDDMIQFVQDSAASDEGKAFDVSNSLDAVLWGTANPTVQQAADRSVTWYTERRQWLEQAISGIAASVSSVGVDGAALNVSVSALLLTVSGLDGNDPVLVADMQGRIVYAGTDRRIQLPSPGLYIVAARGEAVKVAAR